jgi:hypothetical protein
VLRPRVIVVGLGLAALVVGGLCWLLVGVGGDRGEAAAPNPPFHAIYVQHGGRLNGERVGALIGAAAAGARAHGERLVFVMEWAAPKRSYEEWQAADPRLAGIPKAIFLDLDPARVESPDQGPLLLTVMDSWVGWRDAVLADVRLSGVIGPDSNAFAQGVNAALQAASDVVAEWWVEGAWPVEELTPDERQARDLASFSTWLPAYQRLQLSLLCNNNELFKALDQGDPQRFRAQGRQGLLQHRESMRWRNHTMLATLLGLRERRRSDPALRVITVYGLAHAGVPVLKEGLGDELLETLVDPILGPDDPYLLVWSDPEKYFAWGDGAEPERHALRRLVPPVHGTGLEEAYLAGMDRALLGLSPEMLDAFVAAQRGFKSWPLAERQARLNRAFVEFIAGNHPDPAERAFAREYGREWLGVR